MGCYGGVKLDEKFLNKYLVFIIVCSFFLVGIVMYIVIR